MPTGHFIWHTWLSGDIFCFHNDPKWLGNLLARFVKLENDAAQSTAGSSWHHPTNQPPPQVAPPGTWRLCLQLNHHLVLRSAEQRELIWVSRRQTQNMEPHHPRERLRRWSACSPETAAESDGHQSGHIPTFRSWCESLPAQLSPVLPKPSAPAGLLRAIWVPLALSPACALYIQIALLIEPEKIFSYCRLLKLLN